MSLSVFIVLTSQSTLEKSETAKAVKPFPTMYCNEIKRRNLLQEPKKLMEMLAPLDNTSMDAFKNYVLPIWKAGNVPFKDSRCIGTVGQAMDLKVSCDVI